MQLLNKSSTGRFLSHPPLNIKLLEMNDGNLICMLENNLLVMPN